MAHLASIGPYGGEKPVWITKDGTRFLRAPYRSWRAALGETDPDELLAGAPAEGSGDWLPVGGERFGPPISDPSKIVAIGLNYRDHAEEQGKEPPKAPLLFAKAPSCLIGQGDAIRIPPQETQPDAEAELGVVIGRLARRLSVAEARQAVLGYTILNDVSGRAAQYGDKQWFRGKSYDTFCPCGPWIVPAEEIADPHRLGIRAFWNGQAMQGSNTSNLIHDVFALVSYISQQMTLLPGDLIATGTPSGVGVFRQPQVFLKSGDRVRIEIDEIGVLENPVEAG